MTHWRVVILVHTDLVRKEPRRGVLPSGLCSEGRARREPWGASFSLTSTTHIAGVPWLSAALPACFPRAQCCSVPQSPGCRLDRPFLASPMVTVCVGRGGVSRRCGPKWPVPCACPVTLPPRHWWFVPLPRGSCSVKVVPPCCRQLSSAN